MIVGHLSPASGLVPVAIAGVYGLDAAVLPSRSRMVSLRPLRRAATVAAAGLTLAVAAGIVQVPDFRRALVIGAVEVGLFLLLRLTQRGQPAPARTMLIGDRVAVAKMTSEWQLSDAVLPCLVCLIEPQDDAMDLPTEYMGMPVVTASDVAFAAHHASIDLVVVAGTTATDRDLRRLTWQLEDTDIEVVVATEVRGVSGSRIGHRVLDDRLLVTVDPPKRPAVVAGVKAALDRVGAVVLLALLSPVMLGLALAVRLDSRGPALFRQTRVGHDGEPFTMFKLRTMCLDAEQRKAALAVDNESDGPLFKIRFDPRVTRVGRILRKTSLDELPQLLNVVKGEMSLIGPRPALPDEVAQYDDWTRRRLAVKPGMTGLWQVSGRSGLSWEKSVQLDLDYVDNWTPARDLAIAARTVGAVVQREGAY